jgi:hypothetical protein
MLFNQFLKGHKAFVEEQRKVQGSTRRSSPTNSARRVGVWGGSQRLIPTSEQSGLLTHTATTERDFVVRADEKLTAFLELERITHELAVSAILGDDSN